MIGHFIKIDERELSVYMTLKQFNLCMMHKMFLCDFFFIIKFNVFINKLQNKNYVPSTFFFYDFNIIKIAFLKVTIFPLKESVIKIVLHLVFTLRQQM